MTKIPNAMCLNVSDQVKVVDIDSGYTSLTAVDSDFQKRKLRFPFGNLAPPAISSSNKSSPASSATSLISTSAPAVAMPSKPSASKRPRSPSDADKGMTKKPRLLRSNELVTLLAEKTPNADPFTVHKDIACFHSPVFKAAFDSRVIEGETQTHNLKDVCHEAVQLLVHWLYFQTVDLEQLLVKPGDTFTECNAAVQLWVLAEGLLIPKLQNLLVHELSEWYTKHRCLCSSLFVYVYNNTRHNSPLRLFFVHQTICYAGPANFLRYPDRYPKQMLLEIAIEQQKSRKSISELKAATGHGIEWSQYEVAEGDIPEASS